GFLVNLLLEDRITRPAQNLTPVVASQPASLPKRPSSRNARLRGSRQILAQSRKSIVCAGALWWPRYIRDAGAGCASGSNHAGAWRHVSTELQWPPFWAISGGSALGRAGIREPLRRD